jgi:hypothetical protein
MHSFATILILLLILAICIVQFAFFIWLFRKIKEHKGHEQRLSPQMYRRICFGIAGVLLLIAITTSIYSTILLTTGIQTVGVITELRLSHDKDGDEMFAPTFRFVDQTGATNFIDSTLYSSPRRYRVGQTVPVIYRALNSKTARINNFAEHWFVPLITAAFAAVALISIPIRNKWLTHRARKKTATPLTRTVL